MKTSRFMLGLFMAVAIVTIPDRFALAADGYNSAFQSCQKAITERFGVDESITIKRKSFGKQGRGYKVIYVVTQNGDDTAASRRRIVKCKTNSKGAFKSLEVIAD